MAYTSVELSSVEAAITALATGARKASVSLNGKRVDYAPVELAQLRALRDQIQAEVSSAAGRRRFVLTSTSKGF